MELVSPILFSGTQHWLSATGDIFAYNIEGEKVSMISLPTGESQMYGDLEKAAEDMLHHLTFMSLEWSCYEAGVVMKRCCLLLAVLDQYWNPWVLLKSNNGDSLRSVKLWREACVQIIAVKTQRSKYRANKQCGQLRVLDRGHWLHYHILELQMEDDVVMCNFLVNMNVKCGDVATWN